MSDYTANGAIPVEDAAVDDPPTVDEVLERQRIEDPGQYDPSMQHPAPADAFTRGDVDGADDDAAEG